MSRIRANTITNQNANGAPNFPDGITVTGVVTATVSNSTLGTLAVTGNATVGGTLGVGGVLTYEDVTNVDSVGVVTARAGVNLVGNDLNVGSNIKIGNASGIITATSYRGDASQMTGAGLGTDGSANTSGIVTAAAFVPTSQGALSHRNLLMNGAMQVNERGNTAYNPVTSSIYTLDRWRAFSGSSFDRDSGMISQSTQSPDGFSNSIKQDIGNTETPSANQNAGFEQKIEGNNCQSLAYGTSSAKTTTLSFWVYSNKLGTYCVQLMQPDGSKYVLYEYTISATNTWEKKTITIAGNTANAINNDNTPGLRVLWHLCCGSSDHVSATSTWTSSGSFLATSNQVNLWDHADNYWYMTGCQLEIGTVATPFEHRSYGEELLRCKRYYQRSTDSSRGTDYSVAVSSWHAGDGVRSFSKHNTYYDFGEKFEVEMRASPTLTIYGSTTQGDIHLESIAVGSKQVDWNNNTTDVKTKGFSLRHIEDGSDGNYTSGSGNAFGIFAYTVDAEL